LSKEQIEVENKKIEELIAVENLSMKIQAGEILCIVGRNGAGKSTLAKMIAGTITPTGGQIKVSGRVVPFLELGVAFNSELSGYDNTILNGVLLGMERKYIKEIERGVLPNEEEVLTVNNQYNELIITRIRTMVGIDIEEVAVRFGTDYQKYLLQQAHKYLDEGLLQITKNHLKVTRKGKFLSDGIASDLFRVDDFI